MIDVSKQLSGEINVAKTNIENNRSEIKKLFAILETSSDCFDPNEAFECLFDYIKSYDRIYYSELSNYVYNICSDDKDGVKTFATIITNMDSLISKVYDDTFILEWNNLHPDETKIISDAKKASLKLWDHINLANQQYKVLRQSDEDYQNRFEKAIVEHKVELTQKMNAQLITMVSIFTALSFIIFGGISSLADIFSGQSESILKLICVGLVWMIGLLNLIFVFLFCVGKMTKLKFKSTESLKATIFERYPVVFWCNFSLGSLLLLFSVLYYFHSEQLDIWILDYIEKNPRCSSLVIFITIILIIFFSAWFLKVKTNVVTKNGDE